jgi:glycosyltransferase involved in cell wall biosynthesis
MAERNRTSDQLVSVVMPAYRMGAYIGEALGSVARQTHTNWEVIVVDDHAPDDGTTAIVAAFAAAHTRHRVELIRHAVNQGVGQARNTAIDAARGTHLAFLDPDDLWMASHLTKLLAALRQSRGCDAAAGPVVMFRDDAQKRYAHAITWSPWKVRHFPHSLALQNFIQPSAALVRTEAVRGVGGFTTDPALQHVEDHDLWVKLVLAGHRFAFLDRPTSFYRKHGTGATADAERMRRLALRIRENHPGFFAHGQGRMTWAALDAADALEQGPGAWATVLGRLRRRLQGAPVPPTEIPPGAPRQW